MNSLPAGSTVEYTVTWLEMPACRDCHPPDPPEGEEVFLLEARNAPAWYFFSLYDGVGRSYAWDDMHEEDSEVVSAFVSHPEVCIFSMIREGWPQGFFMLDTRATGVCDVSYLGLAMPAIGRGLGSWLVRTAIHRASILPGVRKITVNTCTLDHPRAKPLYIKNGFAQVREEVRTRLLRRDYNPDSGGGV